MKARLVWELIEYSSAGVVLLGVIGEFISDFTRLPKTEAARKHMAKVSTLLLILGLAVELVALVRTTQLSGEEIARLMQEAEIARRDSAQAMERAASADLARLKIQRHIEQIEPRAQLIVSAFAFVSFEVRGIPKDLKPVETAPNEVVGNFIKLDLGRSSEITSNLWRIGLVSGKYSKFAAENAEYFLQFQMSSMHPLFNAKSIRAGDLDEMDVLRILTIFLPEGTEILGGSANVTINSIISREYPIPPQTVGPIGSILCGLNQKK